MGAREIDVLITLVIITNIGHRKGLSQKPGSGKPTAFFLDTYSHEQWR
jgi:hypothetical protein